MAQFIHLEMKMTDKIIKILKERTDKGVWVGAYDADGKPVVTINGVVVSAIKAGKEYGIKIKSKDMEKDNAGMGRVIKDRDTRDTSSRDSKDEV